MSKIGKKPIEIPEKVEVKIHGNRIDINGPEGKSSIEFNPEINIKLQDNKILVSTHKTDKFYRSLFGTTRQLIQNLVTGVYKGHTKELEVIGTGYRASISGKTLTLNVGFASPVNYTIPEDITVKLEGATKIIIHGVDKQKVGQVAAEIRRIRPPDKYKGKGIKYIDERLRLKPGKTAVGKGA